MASQVQPQALATGIVYWRAVRVASTSARAGSTLRQAMSRTHDLMRRSHQHPTVLDDAVRHCNTPLPSSAGRTSRRFAAMHDRRKTSQTALAQGWSLCRC